jgi:TolB-like protein/tRNA A-37 threonylcarbamoyl transferase component Bud32/Tfp pilus assembly protein PilF
VAPTGLEQLQAALGDSYLLERELGRGGMATVYLARDTKHGRQVALKVLHPEFAASLRPDRFRREIAVAGRLQHPHIVSVFDSGETSSGQLWFTMPYVVGESLRDRLRRERQLSTDDMVRITAAIADALQYAHGQGVIHRDVKPENILLSDGHAMLADFGVARSLTAGDAQDDASGTGTLTQSGFAVGTPAYMSPEQASGDRQIDGRSDQYALAVVAYEMLAGEPPFTAPTPQAAIAKMLATPAPSIRIVRKDVPVGVESALRKALSTAPAGRYASVADFGSALTGGLHTGTVDAAKRGGWRTGAVIAVGLMVIAAGAIGYVRYRLPAAPTMLAVLPFETEGDTADAWITDGITDEVRGKLAGISSLRVIARSSSNRYRRSTKRPEEIGRELGVRYLLMGRIRWSPGTGAQRQIRVEPELVEVADVATPQTKWEQPFDEQQSDIFRLQSDIAERVASALQVALNPAERVAISRPSTRNPDAYYAYLRGVALNRTELPNDDVRARQEFRRAVELDSTFADAWIALANNISRWAARHSTSAAFQDSARAATDRAQAIEPGHPDVINARAFYDELIRHDLPKAYTEYRAVSERAPSSSGAIRSLAALELRLGHWDLALVHFERSAQLSPRDPYAFNELGNAYLLVRRYSDARRATTQARQLSPNNILTAFSLIQIPLAEGDLAGARSAVRAASPGIDSLTFYAFLAQYGSYTWVLDTNQQRALLGVPQSAYDRGHSAYALTRMLLYDELGDSTASKAYADSAAVALQADNHGYAADSDAAYGWALAMAGRRTEAIAAGDSYLRANPIERDYLDNVDNAESSLKAYVRAGATTKALDLLDRLLHIPGRLTPGRIRLDPAFAPLRSDPRFQRLATSRAAGE